MNAIVHLLRIDVELLNTHFLATMIEPSYSPSFFLFILTKVMNIAKKQNI